MPKRSTEPTEEAAVYQLGIDEFELIVAGHMIILDREQLRELIAAAAEANVNFDL